MKIYKAIKKPIEVKMEEFEGTKEIKTLEGVHTGHGETDLLVTGIRGEQYFIKKDIAFETYDIVEQTSDHTKQLEGNFSCAMENIHLSYNINLLSNENLHKLKESAESELEKYLNTPFITHEVKTTKVNKLDIINKEIERRFGGEK